MRFVSSAKRVREHLGLSASDVAAKLECTTQCVYKNEAAREGATKPYALAFADAYPDALAELGLTVEDLLRGTPQQEEQGAA